MSIQPQRSGRWCGNGRRGWLVVFFIFLSQEPPARPVPKAATTRKSSSYEQGWVMNTTESMAEQEKWCSAGTNLIRDKDTGSSVALRRLGRHPPPPFAPPPFFLSLCFTSSPSLTEQRRKKVASTVAGILFEIECTALYAILKLLQMPYNLF
ncbi:hypothetical protein Zm00014a_028137 [Zea mays]|uniref:Uncharacterized protein n=1 Tax=Zea mays TaxID=4577 RepID=A0A3L6EP03_MAIZE|nr:hypothetical protein Zm00014a_028137 [Zea mays]